MADQDYRGLGGVGEHNPPPFDRSRSEGELRRYSYRDSVFNRLTLQAICNDDGTPVTGGVEKALDRIEALLERIAKKLEA